MNELYHHGVKGMKWGIRKNEKKAVENYKVFSKSLGRYLTEQELIDKGLL